MPVCLLFLLTGDVTGPLGTAHAVAVDCFKRRQKGKHELALRKVDLDITHAESESAERVEAIDAESKAWGGLMASYRNAITRWSRGNSTWLVFVDVVRGLTRAGRRAAVLEPTVNPPRNESKAHGRLSVASWWHEADFAARFLS